MTIQWYGQSCFRLEGKDASLLIDPFSKETGLKQPRIHDQIVLVTHSHHDHNNIEGIDKDTFLINGPGEYEIQGVNVLGIQSFHDNAQGQERGFNTIYSIKIEDLKICHLGDLGQDSLNETQLDKIDEPDILIIPIGGKYTISAKEAVGIINQIEPRIIIPMHYKIPDLKIDIEGPEKFIKELGLKPEKIDKYKITKKTLPVENTQLIMFEI